MFQRLAKVLFKAAKESSYVDPQKVEDVLKVKIEDTESTEGCELFLFQVQFLYLFRRYHFQIA